MFGPLFSAAVRTLGMAGSSAVNFGNRMLAGQPKRFGAMHFGTPYASEGMGAMKWLAESSKEAAKALMFVSRMGVAGLGATKALELFANNLIQSRENLSLFHGGIAATFAQMERQQLGLQLRRAQATGPGVQRFADAVMRMREDTLQGRILMDNIWNSVGTGMATIVSFIATTAEPTLKMIQEKLVQWGVIPPPDAARNRVQGDLMDFLGQMSRGQFGQPINQRPGRNGRQ